MRLPYRRRVNRRLQRRNDAKQRRQLAAQQILDRMRDGAVLLRSNRPTRTVWSLSTGEFLTSEAAADVLHRTNRAFFRIATRPRQKYKSVR